VGGQVDKNEIIGITELSTMSATISYSDKFTFGELDTMDYPEGINGKVGISNYWWAIYNSASLITNLKNGTDTHIVSFPSYFDRLPNLPISHFKLDKDGNFELVEVITDQYNGFLRNWEPIQIGSKAGIVVADHGQELLEGERSDWPEGGISVFTVGDDGLLELVRISEKMYTHGVSVADFNRDGLDDILFEGHSLRPDKVETDDNVFIYVQNSDGTFTKMQNFLPEINAKNAELVYFVLTAEAANLDLDEDVEIVLASYGATEPTAFLVFDKNTSGEFVSISSEERSGKAAPLGTTNVEFADLDNDGDLDMAFRLEGDSAISDYSGRLANGSVHGVQIWENKGNLSFENVTDIWLENSVWDAFEFWNKTIELVDLNSDGYVDLFWNSGSHSVYNSNTSWDAGSWIFLNQKGDHFTHLHGNSEFIIEFINDGGVNDQWSHTFKLNDVTQDYIEVLTVHENQTFGLIHLDVQAINEDLL
jgi:hypothetical protein